MEAAAAVGLNTSSDAFALCNATVTAHGPANWTLHQINGVIGNGSCQCHALELLINAALARHNQPTITCDPLLYPISIQLLYTTLFVSTISSALIGNLVVIWIILRHSRMRTTTNYFLLNLAIADAAISSLNVIMSFSFNLYYDWFFGEWYCYVNNLTSVAPTCASSGTLMLMSWERYNVIVYPLRRRLSRLATVSCIIGIWLIAFLSALPNMLATNYSAYYNPDSTGYIVRKHMCNSGSFGGENGTDSQAVLWFMRYNWYLLFVQYLLPLGVLSFTYLFITKELWCSKHIGEHQNHEQLRAKKKVVKMLGAVVLIFMCCWLPYHLYFISFNFIHNLIEPQALAHVYIWIYWLAMSTPVWPPVIYYNMNTRCSNCHRRVFQTWFQIGFKYAFRWTGCVKLTRTEYQQSELFDQRYALQQRSFNRRAIIHRRAPRGRPSAAGPRSTHGQLNEAAMAGAHTAPLTATGYRRQKLSLQARSSESELGSRFKAAGRRVISDNDKRTTFKFDAKKSSDNGKSPTHLRKASTRSDDTRLKHRKYRRGDVRTPESRVVFHRGDPMDTSRGPSPCCIDEAVELELSQPPEQPPTRPKQPLVPIYV